MGTRRLVAVRTVRVGKVVVWVELPGRGCQGPWSMR